MTIRITPLTTSDRIVELSKGSNIFEKQIIPYGTFGYQGDKFTITPEWADNAINAFESRAFDQTVFALADENNSHSVDNRPDRFGGEVLKLKKTATGINAVFRLTNKAAQLVDDTNKKLGVSVRFHENYHRESDGKSWPVAIDQVLGTTDPKITGMEPWKAITLSNVAPIDQNDIKDSSNEEWEMTKPIETPVDPKDTPKNGPDEDKVTLTKDEYADFKKLLAAQASSDLDDNNDADLDKLVDELEKKEVKQPVGLSNEAKRVIELSHQVALGRFERDALAWKQAGVPPKIIELAQPVLASYDEVRVVSLSNGTPAISDAREVVKAILEECKGIVNLSNEQGHGLHDGGNKQDKEFDDLYKNILNQVEQF